jgi:hypothetical protein
MIMKELINAKHNYCVLYTVLWRDVSTQYGHRQGSNIQFIKGIVYCILYRGADKSLARPGRKQATATEGF